MSLVDDMAVSAAERVESSVGARTALPTYRALVLKLDGMGARARAVLGVLRCATSLGELEQVSVGVGWWHSISGDYLTEVVAVTASLVRRGALTQACELAEAEAARFPSARASYLLARAHAARGDALAAEASWADAAARAEREGLTALEITARVARASSRVRREPTSADALAEATRAKERGATGLEAVACADVLLRSGSRFQRAGALALLEEVARREGPGAAQAVHMAASHVDAAGAALTSLEVDRARAVLRLWPVVGEREAALARLDAVAGGAAPAGREAWANVDPECRAHAARVEVLLNAGSAARRPPPEARRSTRGELAWVALDAVGKLRDDPGGAGAAVLDRLRQTVARGLEADALRAAPTPVWAAARLGLTGAPAAREHATRLTELLLRTPAVPPRGFLELAGALHAAGQEALAEQATRRALAAREPAARDQLVRMRLVEGWRQSAEAEAGWRDGDPARARAARKVAIAALREARELAELTP